jgi:hypothetical protein
MESGCYRPALDGKMTFVNHGDHPCGFSFFGQPLGSSFSFIQEKEVFP